jgi:hypothetical protein
MASFYRTEIQEALVTAAKAGVFYPVTYDKDTQFPVVDEANPEVPYTVLVNEINAAFEVATHNRMTGKRERTTWDFQLRLKFRNEVILEVFEDAMAATPLRIAAVPAEGKRQVTLEIEGSDPGHPVQQESSTGTQVVYNFKASLSPA